MAKGKEFSVEVHHEEGVSNWEAIIDNIFEHLLCRPERLVVLCRDCHGETHAKEELLK